MNKTILITLLLCCYFLANSQDYLPPAHENFTETTNSLNIEMIYVEGGTFIMGCTHEQGYDCFADEKPAHIVTLSSFYIGKYEVTQAQWKAIMGSNPSDNNPENNFAKDHLPVLPVENVSWNDAQVFIRKLNAATGKTYRLPTEAEWEFAARGGNQTHGYRYSGGNTLDDVAWYVSNSDKTTHPIGTKLPNELGIYDMSGNVYEWCQDWYGDYNSSDQKNPKGTSSGTTRVLRCGCWSYLAQFCRVSRRGFSAPDSRTNGSGFRLVLVP